MTENTGKVVSVNGNLVSVSFEGNVSMNEICYVNVDDTKLKSEVIRIRGDVAQIQVYEMTGGIKCGDPVDFTGEMLSAQLGPGLLGQVYDGLQNPLPVLAEQAGWFLERGIYADGLDAEKKWEFTPTAKIGVSGDFSEIWARSLKHSSIINARSSQSLMILPSFISNKALYT